MDATTLRRELVGAWRLVSYECRSVADGSVHHPMGRSATGLIVYSPDGYVSAQLMADSVPPISTGDLTAADDAELAAAARNYIAYSGPYEISPDGRLTHHMTVSLFPNWRGQTQERAVSLDGDRLRLATTEPVLLGGVRCHGILHWTRA